MGPGGSVHQFILWEGAVCIRTGAAGWEGPGSQARVPSLLGLGHKHMMPHIQAFSGRLGESHHVKKYKNNKGCAEWVQCWERAPWPAEKTRHEGTAELKPEG